TTSWAATQSPAGNANVSEPQRPPNNSALAQALQLTQGGLSVFQRLQEQTAQLHRQFLQTQETAQQTLTRLIEQQQQLLLASLGAPPLCSAASPSEPRAFPPRPSEEQDRGCRPPRSPTLSTTPPPPAPPRHDSARG